MNAVLLSWKMCRLVKENPKIKLTKQIHSLAKKERED